MRYSGISRAFTFKGLTFPATLIDAKTTVKFNQTERDLTGAIRGDGEHCVRARAILRNSDSGVFPHPVLAAKVTRSCALVVRSNAKQHKGKVTPGIVVRYLHAGSEDTKKVDRNQPVVAEKEIVLYAPGPSKRLGADRQTPRNSGHGNHRPSSERVAKPRVCGTKRSRKGLKGREMDLAEYEKEMKGPKIYTGKG